MLPKRIFLPYGIFSHEDFSYLRIIFRAKDFWPEMQDPVERGGKKKLILKNHLWNMVPEEEEVKRLRALRVLRPDKTSPGHKLTLRGHTLQQMADGCLHPDKGEERRGKEMEGIPLRPHSNSIQRHLPRK